MQTANEPKDRGAILPMVLVVVIVLGIVVAATATYASSSLRYGQVVESRSDRLAAAQAATNDAMEQLDQLTRHGADRTAPTRSQTRPPMSFS